MSGYPGLSQVQDAATRACLKRLFDLVQPLGGEITQNAVDALAPAGGVTDLRRSRAVNALDAKDLQDLVTLRQLRQVWSETTGGGDFVEGPTPAVSTDGNIALWDSTSGRLIKDGGLGLAGVVRIVTKDFSSAEFASMQATNDTGVAIVAAQGAGKIIVPVSWSGKLHTTTIYTNTPALVLHLSGRFAQTFSSTGGGLGWAQIPPWIVAWTEPIDSSVIFEYGTFDPENKALVVNVGAPLTGAGEATARMSVAYLVFTAP